MWGGNGGGFWGGRGASSISIHEAQCLKKFEEQQALLPAEQRRAAPSRMSVDTVGLSREERNAKAREAYEEQVMVACVGCGRTFSGQDRLEVHMRGCDAAKGARQGSTSGTRECMVPGGSGGGGELGGGGGDRGTVKAAPKMCMCYICGREYGSLR